MSAPHASSSSSHSLAPPPAASSSNRPRFPVPSKPKPSTYKVCIIGEAGVGKTALRRRFTHAYQATLGADFVAKTVPLSTPSPSSGEGEGQARLQIWDTAGSERFRALGSAFYRAADACLLVYSSTDRDSLKRLEGWMKEFVEKRPVVEGKEAGFVFVGVGAKVDLVGGEKGKGGWEGHDGLGHDGLGHDDSVSKEEAAAFLDSLLPPPSIPDPGRDLVEVGGMLEVPPGYTREEVRTEMEREMPLHPEGINGTPPKTSTLKGKLLVPPTTAERNDDGEEGEGEGEPPVTPAKSRASTRRLPGSQLTTTTTLSIYHTPPSSMRHRPRSLSSGSSTSTRSVDTVTRTRTDPTSQEPPPPPVEDVPTLFDSNGDATPHPPLSPPLDHARHFAHFRVSSKTGEGVDELFEWVARRCREQEERERMEAEADEDAREAEEERRRAEVKIRDAESNKSWFGRCC